MFQGYIRVFMLMLADAVTITVTVGCAAVLYRACGADLPLFNYWKLWPMLPIFIVAGGFFRLYHGSVLYPGAAIGPIEEIRRLSFTITLSFSLLLAYLLLSRRSAEFSRVVLVASWGLDILLLPIGRWIARSLMKKLGFGQIPVLIAGAGHGGRIAAELLAHDRHFGLSPVGFVDDNLSEAVAGLPVLGKLSDAAAIAKTRRVDYILCCLPLTVIRDALRLYMQSFRHVTLIPDVQIFPIAWAYPLNFHGHGGIEIRNQMRCPLPLIWKTLLELLLSLFGLVVSAPLLLILSLMVRISSRGPIFYKARRLGRGGKAIQVLKFRTMYADADARLKQMLAENPALKKEWDAKFKLEKDPRITPIGRFLRRTSLDELPQFINVFRGDMAMIGPRPIVPAEIGKYGDRYEILKLVKPGVTGLWQVSGRSDTDYEQRVNLDMNYIMNWTVWMDYYILLKTVKEVLFCRGAK